MPDGHDTRMHTAEHLLNQNMVRMFGCSRCFSAHLNRKKSKCDYRFSRDITEEEKKALEQGVNQAIAEDLEVKEEHWSLAATSKRFDLSRLPESVGDTVRIIRIGDYDLCPCRGGHVSKTSELGRFKITTRDFSNGVLRLRFKLDSISSVADGKTG